MEFILKDLDRNLTLLDGTPVRMFNSDAPLTFKKALVSICELHQPSQMGEGEALQAFDIGLKIFKAKDSITLSEDELEALKEFVKSSRVYLAGVVGQLYRYLESAEKTTS